jgi:undecaprenyl-diphosphatase
VLRWVRQFVHNLYAAGGILLIAGLVLSVLALWGLSGLTEGVMEGETLSADEAALRWFAGQTTDRRDVRALEVTSLGSGTVVLTISIISAALLAALGRRYYAILVVVAVCGGWVMSPILKALFGRDRPQVVEWRVPHAGQASFPSGHAMMGMVLYVVLAYVIHRLASRFWVSAVAITLAALLVTLIGITRVYLGVHYPSDVLAGYAVGFSWAMFCAAGAEMLKRER